MATVLVTGGTGVLGSYLVPRLLARGNDVRVLSRHAPPSVQPGVTAVQGNVRTGEGLNVASVGCDTVIHAATNLRRARTTEVEGTRNVVEAAKRAGADVLYVSIVGVDRHRLPYYRAKWEAEQIVEGSGTRWTILRATQFHDLLDGFLALRVLPLPRATPFQPVDGGDVSDVLAGLVDAGPCGRAPDVGGPQVLTIKDMNDVRARMTGHRALLVPVPPIWFLGDFAAGRHLCPDRAVGRISWEEWLSRRHPRRGGD
jgi:uncharacterized protein YbjT (DUF2867 family)